MNFKKSLNHHKILTSVFRRGLSCQTRKVLFNGSTKSSLVKIAAARSTFAQAGQENILKTEEHQQHKLETLGMAILSENTIQDFQAEFKPALNCLLGDPFVRNSALAQNWLKRLVNYNVLDGKQMRAKILLSAYFSLVPEPTPREREQIFGVAWATEFFQAEGLVCDDIMDDSSLRRGRPCWHLVPTVGMSACNDIIALDKFAFRLLKHYLGQMSYYSKLVDLFQESIFIASVGQNLDDHVSKQLNLSLYTPQVYNQIIDAKTAHYGFYLPVAIAIIMAQHSRLSLKLDEVSYIMMKIGRLFQMQDDYLDVFGKRDVIGKNGTDILNRKCAWPIVTALDLAKNSQREILEENYGGKSTVKLAKVMDVFLELQIPQIYEEIQQDYFEDILAASNQLPMTSIQQITRFALDSIFNRNC